MVSIRRSLALSFLDRYTGMATAVVAAIVLARLLTPTEIGLYAVVASLTSIAHRFRDFGIGQYLIQTTELTEDNVRSAFTLTLVFAWSIAVLFFTLSPFVAKVFNEPTVQQILIVVAINSPEPTIDPASTSPGPKRRRMPPIVCGEASVMLAGEGCSADGSLDMRWLPEKVDAASCRVFG